MSINLNSSMRRLFALSLISFLGLAMSDPIPYKDCGNSVFSHYYLLSGYSSSLLGAKEPRPLTVS